MTKLLARFEGQITGAEFAAILADLSDEEQAALNAAVADAIHAATATIDGASL